MNPGYFFLFLTGVPLSIARISVLTNFLEPQAWVPENVKDAVKNVVNEYKSNVIRWPKLFKTPEMSLESYLELDDHVLIGTNTKILYMTESKIEDDKAVLKNAPKVKNFHDFLNSIYQTSTVTNRRCELTREKYCDFSGCSATQLVKTCNKPKFGKCGYTSNPRDSYVKLLVVTHSNYWDNKPWNAEEIVTIVQDYWTRVDMRFREITCPTIRLSITGILISKDKEIDALINKDGNIKSSLNLCLRQDTLVPKFDVIVGMEKMVIDDTKPRIPYNQLIEGKSTGTLCSQTDNYIYVKDSFPPIAVLSAVQGIAKLFGVKNLYETEEHSNTTNLWTFSFTSRKKFRQFFINSNGTCLFQRPNIGIPLMKSHLEISESLNGQCKMAYGKDASWDGPDQSCKILSCLTPNGRKDIGIPAEGSVCNKDGTKVCINGKCIVPKKHIIDYVAVDSGLMM